jgi:hypothetical protein
MLTKVSSGNTVVVYYPHDTDMQKTISFTCKCIIITFKLDLVFVAEVIDRTRQHCCLAGNNCYVYDEDVESRFEATFCINSSHMKLSCVKFSCHRKPACV